MRLQGTGISPVDWVVYHTMMKRPFLIRPMLAMLSDDFNQTEVRIFSLISRLNLCRGEICPAITEQTLLSNFRGLKRMVRNYQGRFSDGCGYSCVPYGRT